jgi:hypothetical protein
LSQSIQEQQREERDFRLEEERRWDDGEKDRKIMQGTVAQYRD